MLIRRPDDIPSSEITPEGLYQNRRAFIGTAGTLALGALVAPANMGAAERQKDDITPEKDATTYNNFYEFGTSKEDPAENAKDFRATPWTVNVEGLVKNPRPYDINELLGRLTVYDRTYRMRCVEAWSMVIPWQGIQLRDIINRVEPLPSAKFVEFTTLFDPRRMPGQRSAVLPWPYKEALRMDEAMHPLTLFATGMYGKPLPNQNGAPLRLVVPWKYGFKGIKSIVKIRFTEAMPNTASTPTSIRRSIIRAGVRPRNAALGSS
jgi:methionine sulfoxide reductase catalytic subunit